MKENAANIYVPNKMTMMLAVGTALVSLAGCAEGSRTPHDEHASEPELTAPAFPVAPSASERPIAPRTLGEWLATDPAKPECSGGVELNLVTERGWGDATALEIGPLVDPSLEGQEVVTIVNTNWHTNEGAEDRTTWSSLQPGIVQNGMAPAASVPAEVLRQAVANNGNIATYITNVPANFMDRELREGGWFDGLEVLERFPDETPGTLETSQLKFLSPQCSNLHDLQLERAGGRGSPEVFDAQEHLTPN